ncbi:hypothetical protein DL96DRAFT_1523407 [Flagelloscypha sp. PMI_526]|nr:hypothetical protein DL96DRAFT_1523407 [Flagelloscypha sp. PMI_526]
MVLGIIGTVIGTAAVPMAAVAVPNSAVGVATSVVGLSQGFSNQQEAASKDGKDVTNPKEDPKLAKFNLHVHCESDSSARSRVHGKIVVLKDRKMYLDDPNPSKRKFKDAHPFSGFYIEWPFGVKPPPQALVSTIKPDPPELNWIYIDKDTLQLGYGTKSQSLPHTCYPWDWTEDQQSLVFDGWEGFVALEETPGVWVVCYDANDDHLKKVRKGRRVLEVSLDRKVLPMPPPEAEKK